jgi:adenylate cyclase
MLFAVIITTLQMSEPAETHWTVSTLTTLSFIQLYFFYYLSVLVRARQKPPSRWEGWFRTILEVSAPTLIVFVQAQSNPESALLNTPMLVFMLGIFTSVLRMRPWLALFAGFLAGAEWLSMYIILGGIEMESPHLSPVIAVQHAVSMAFAGLLAMQLASSIYRLCKHVSSATIERENVRRAFGAYVAEPVVERVLSGELVLRTERRPISVLFVDIRGFTTFAQMNDPDTILEKLNLALDSFAVEVEKRGGIVNKFLGDGLMAIFGAPVVDEHHARNAYETGIAMVIAAQRLVQDGSYPELRIGVGVHCGEVVVGDIGGRGHREYTAIGDVVNVAARIEAMTKTLNVEMLVSEAVRSSAQVDNIDQSFEGVTLRGRTVPVMLHAPHFTQAPMAALSGK